MSTLYVKNPTGNFEEDFERPFGQHGKVKVCFGEGYECAENPVTVVGFFDTPSHQELDVSLSSHTNAFMAGDRVLIVSEDPNFVNPDMEVGRCYYMDGTEGETGKSDGRLSMFVNDTAEDPDPPWIRDGSQPEPYLRPRTTWLRPSTRYYWKVERLQLQQDGTHPALFCEYYGTSPSDGKEVPLESYPTLVIDGKEFYIVPVHK